MMWAFIIMSMSIADDRTPHKEIVGYFNSRSECERAAGNYGYCVMLPVGCDSVNGGSKR